MSAHSFPWGQPSSRIHFFPQSFSKLRWGENLGTPIGPPRSQSCPTRVARPRHSSAGIRESQKHPQPLTYHLQELPQSQRLLSFLQGCGHLSSPILASLSPGRGQQEPWASPKGSSASRAGAALALAGAAPFLSPQVLLQVYLPRSPALAFPIHLAHPGPPESAADLPWERSLSDRDSMAFAQESA